MPFFLAAAVPFILKGAKKVVQAVKAAKVVKAAAKAAKAAKSALAVVKAAAPSSPVGVVEPPGVQQLQGHLGAAINGGQLPGVTVTAAHLPGSESSADALKKYAPIALGGIGLLVVVKMVLD